MPDAAGHPHGLPLAVGNLRVEGRGGRILLDVPALTLDAGSSLGIYGPSGAGKATLLHALAGLSHGATGWVAWGDTDILALPPRARGRFRRTRMGFVFQDAVLFEELSAQANAAVTAMFAPHAEREALRRAAGSELARLGLGV